MQDETTFKACMTHMLSWNFDRVIVGHGEPIMSSGKEKVTQMLRRSGY